MLLVHDMSSRKTEYILVVVSSDFHELPFIYSGVYGVGL